jgi:predicted nucleic acid-binding protein
VSTVVIDTGPLVALLNRRDTFHRWVRDVLESVEPPIFTCELVIAEACFLLRDVGGGPDAVLELLERDVVQIDFHLGAEVAPIRSLMKKFANVPMSLADACLVRMTELEPRSVVMTLDDDFRVYRRNRRQPVPTITPTSRH